MAAQDKCPFAVGDVVVAAFIGGYGNHLTEGKAYVVIGCIDDYTGSGFRYPPYVEVVGDMGGSVTAHAHRFRAA